MSDGKPNRQAEKTQAWEPLPGELITTQAFDEPLKLAGSEPVDSAPATQLGDFKLIAKLGEGGMGSVYRAQQVSRGREVAVKILQKSISTRPGFLERFQREARMMGKLQHPHIVRYLAAGESQGWFYLAMELVSGGSVAGRLKQHGKLSPGEAVRIAIQTCSALQYAHDQGLVHRDVKPDNLLLTTDGQVKLADLGLAKTIEESSADLTSTGQGIGTPLYAAPEQTIDAKRADGRSDLYSLGGVLYECLTGRPAFTGRNLLELLQAKERGTFPVPSYLVKGLPASLDRIVLKLLAKLPDHRYQSAAEALQELEWTGLSDSP